MSAAKLLGLWLGHEFFDWEWNRYVVCWLAYDLVGEPEPPWNFPGGDAGRAADALDAFRQSEQFETETFAELLCVALKRLQQATGSLGGDLDEEITWHLGGRDDGCL